MGPPPGPIPPALPPTVEEAYRRKCVLLKQRMNEVEDANDASRIRLARMQRGIEKLRLERAYLLEQLAKRTSTNVEDSEGSPSPPPTPKEKPLRTKRGHRKPSFLANLDAARGPPSTFVANNQAMTLSPSNSDAFSHTQTAAPRLAPAVATTNGTKPANASETSRRPRNAFELFANENRSVLEAQMPKDGNFNVDKELAVKWRAMGREGQDPYHQQFEASDLTAPGSLKKEIETMDEDVEMGGDGDEEEEG